jgi:hypothetical protein
MSDLPEYVVPFSGEWVAWLGQQDSETAVLSQSMVVPPGQPLLSYFYWTDSSDGCGFDFAGVYVNGATMVENTLCLPNSTGGWIQHSIDLTPYVGQEVVVEFVLRNDVSYVSNWYIDNVGFVPAN